MQWLHQRKAQLTRKPEIKMLHSHRIQVARAPCASSQAHCLRKGCGLTVACHLSRLKPLAAAAKTSDAAEADPHGEVRRCVAALLLCPSQSASIATTTTTTTTTTAAWSACHGSKQRSRVPGSGLPARLQLLCVPARPQRVCSTGEGGRLLESAG